MADLGIWRADGRRVVGRTVRRFTRVSDDTVTCSFLKERPIDTNCTWYIVILYMVFKWIPIADF